MDYRIDDIRNYFKNWVIELGSQNNKILEFLKNPTDEEWMTIYDMVHQEAFPTEEPIIQSVEAAKAFLGDEIEKVRQFVLEWEKERYGDLGDGSIETDILDDVALVNRYFFIHGEDIVEEWMEDPINY